jgi:hypothetical protein
VRRCPEVCGHPELASLAGRSVGAVRSVRARGLEKRGSTAPEQQQAYKGDCEFATREVTGYQSSFYYKSGLLFDN